MTLSDFQDHAPIASFLKCSCAAVDKIASDVVVPDS